MNRSAFVALDIKAMDEDARLLEGWATLAEMDRVGDVVLPRGGIYELPLPFLLDHDHRKAVGEVDRVEVSDKGIKFWAHIKKIAEPGEVKDLCDTAWSLVKNGLRKSVSIGFRAMDFDILPTGGLKFTSWEWLELSAVTVPAAPGARITNFKSVAAGDTFMTVCPPENPTDPKQQAAPGQKRFCVVRLTPPATGTPQLKSPQEGSMKISEKIRRFEEKRAANVARITAIHEETDESLSDAQLEEVKGLEAEIATIDRDLPSLKAAETNLANTAKPVRTVEQPGDPAAPSQTPGVTVKAPVKPEPGIRMARYVRCLGLANKEKVDVLRVAKNLYGERDPEVVAFIQKAAGTAIGALNTTTDSSLIGNEGIIGDFVEFLRAQTIIGKFGTNGIPSLRRIPFRVPLVSQATGGTAYWVGEGDGKPLTKPSFGRTELAPLKVAAIAVATMELLRDSSPAAERMIRDDLAAAVAARLDVTFVGPSVTASNGVSPASISNGAESIVSTATTDADAIRLEVRSVMQKFIDALNPLTSGVWVMSSSTALALSMMVNTLGQSEFPGININGGTFMGLPVIVSDHVTDYVVLVNAMDIWFGDEGGIAIDMSDQASLQMVAGDDEGSTLSSTTPTAAQLVSLWQTNSVGFRAERTVNWARRRTSAVAVLTDVDWGGTVLPS